ncbi:2-oxoacid:acceptor oxidoreductase family protein [Megasphaera hexanoica]|nr:2-oxoacid:acceptor oxidoreductase family protein [Megasphaera hexanoica]
MIEIRWHGRGGQGAFTAARLLGLAASVMGGKYALAFPSFGPERRGAPVLGFTKIDDIPIRNRSQITHCDYAVVLDDSLVTPEVFQGLKPGGIVFINTAKPEAFSTYKQEVVAFDAETTAARILGRPIVNVAMMAALVAKTGLLTLDACLDAVDEEFKPELREKNRAVFKEIYRWIREREKHE